MQFTLKKPIIRRLLITISCNIATYYRLIIYSNIMYVLYEQKKQWLVKRWWHGVESHLMDKLKDSAADGKTKSHV